MIPELPSSGAVAGDSSASEAERTRMLLAAIVDSSDDAIISQSLQGIVTSWNKAAERIFGYTAGEMIGQSILRLACEGRENDLLSILERIRAGERVDHYETRRRCKDGREITVSLTVSPIRDSRGTMIGASKVVRDITVQRQAEAALRTSEKLAVIGRMAASIAHEINNPLEAVTNLLYLLESQSLDAKSREYLDMAQHELRRVAHITVQTLGFYRQTPEANAAILPDVVDAALSLHQGKITTTSVQVEKDYDPVPPVPCPEGDLRQVFANLISNALDAMSSGGCLRIRIRRARDWRTGGHGVRVSINDDGSGINAETRRTLFQPFRTTKGLTGTGLGLWISLEIVQKLGGRISVRSRQRPAQSGTTFAVYLPLEPSLVSADGQGAMALTSPA